MLSFDKCCNNSLVGTMVILRICENHYQKMQYAHDRIFLECTFLFLCFLLFSMYFFFYLFFILWLFGLYKSYHNVLWALWLIFLSFVTKMCDVCVCTFFCFRFHDMLYGLLWATIEDNVGDGWCHNKLVNKQFFDVFWFKVLWKPECT